MCSVASNMDALRPQLGSGIAAAVLEAFSSKAEAAVGGAGSVGVAGNKVSYTVSATTVIPAGNEVMVPLPGRTVTPSNPPSGDLVTLPLIHDGVT